MTSRKTHDSIPMYIVDRKSVTGMARALRQALLEDKLEISHSRALQALAVAMGFQSANALSAATKDDVLILATDAALWIAHSRDGGLMQALELLSHATDAAHLCTRVIRSIPRLGDVSIGGMPSGHRFLPRDKSYCACTAVTHGAASGRLMAFLCPEDSPVPQPWTSASSHSSWFWWERAVMSLNAGQNGLRLARGADDDKDVVSSSVTPQGYNILECLGALDTDEEIALETPKQDLLHENLVDNFLQALMMDGDDNISDILLSVHDRRRLVSRMETMLANGISMPRALESIASDAASWPHDKGAGISVAATRAFRRMSGGANIRQTFGDVCGSLVTVVIDIAAMGGNVVECRCSEILEEMDTWHILDNVERAKIQGRSLALLTAIKVMMSGVRTETFGQMLDEAITLSQREEAGSAHVTDFLPQFSHMRTYVADILQSVSRTDGQGFGTFPSAMASDLRSMGENHVNGLMLIRAKDMAGQYETRR